MSTVNRIQMSLFVSYINLMISFLQKTIPQINNEVKKGGTVIATAEPVMQGSIPEKNPLGVNVVTTATFGNYSYMLPRPSAMPVKPNCE